MTRQQERYESAKRLVALTSDQLFERYGITRVGELTGLDTIGVPVWSSCRPMSHSVSAHAGKSRDSMMAKAGAIAEGIEIALFEKPDHEPIHLKTFYHKEHFKEMGFPVASYARDEVYEVEQEPVLHYASGTEILFPSDLVWLDQRKNSPFLRSSNGQALGATMEDAVLQGLYECIERDAMTIWQLSGNEPPLIKLNLDEAPDAIGQLTYRIAKAGLRLFVSKVTYDIPLPIYRAILLDPSESHAPFYGYGTSIFDCIAVEKAILEAIQSRAVYIAGARDDISRSRYDDAKLTNQRMKIAKLDMVQPRLPVDWSSYDITTEEEFGWAINDIGPWAVKIFIKMIKGGDFPAAKVIIPGLEPPILDGFQSVRWEKLKGEGKNTHIRWPYSVRL